MTDTRTKIVEAAQQIIADEGWGAATTRRVAEVAAVNSGVIHYHVGNVHDLRREAVLEGVASYFCELRNLTGDRTDLADRLRALIRTITSIDGTSRNARLLYASLGAAAHDPELRNVIKAEIGSLQRELAAHTSAGRAQLLTAAIDGLVMQRAFGVEIDAGTLIPVIEQLLNTYPTDGDAQR
ncbi:TetR/AcrR family transcriptional regulator [Demequina sp. SO4-13]|uniref:TetR/AcrR family transcriptional regulator n=1 Tax=Demequina sp. SO4-13 TaxID=3401027 RepID=UPI003AF53F38